MKQKKSITDTVDQNKNDINEDIKRNNIKKSNSFLRIAGTIIRWILIIILLFFIFLLVRMTFFKKNDIFGYRFYIIMSGSMSPTIDIGDVAIIKEEDNIKVNDVVAYSEANSTVVHRVIEINSTSNEENYITKGDNNNAKDLHPIKKSNIQGKYVGKIKGLGNAFSFIKKHLIIFMVGIVIIMVIIVIRRLL